MSKNQVTPVDVIPVDVDVIKVYTADDIRKALLDTKVVIENGEHPLLSKILIFINDAIQTSNIV